MSNSVKVTSVESNTSVTIHSRFIPKRGEVVFDVTLADGVAICMNISIENAREISGLLRGVNRDAAIWEKEQATTNVGGLVTLIRGDHIYLVHPDIPNLVDVNRMSNDDLFRAADIVLSNGAVLKSVR